MLGRAWYERRRRPRPRARRGGHDRLRRTLPRKPPRINPAGKPTAASRKNKAAVGAGQRGRRDDADGRAAGAVDRLRRPARAVRAGPARIESFTLIRQSPAGIAMRVTGPSGSSIDDRILLRTGRTAISRSRWRAAASFTFADRRSSESAGQDRVSGDLRAMRLKVPGPRTLVLNGRAAKASCADGLLVFKGS